MNNQAPLSIPRGWIILGAALVAWLPIAALSGCVHALSAPAQITAAAVAPLVLPPAQFEHTPTRPYSVAHVDITEVEKFCPPVGNQTMLGCTVLNSYILLRNDMTPEATAHVLRHEIGHVNGWNH